MKFRKFLIRVADIYRFTIRVLKDFFVPPYEWKEILRQCYEVGNKCLFLIGFTAFIAGIVFTNSKVAPWS